MAESSETELANLREQCVMKDERIKELLADKESLRTETRKLQRKVDCLLEIHETYKKLVESTRASERKYAEEIAFLTKEISRRGKGTPAVVVSVRKDTPIVNLQSPPVVPTVVDESPAAASPPPAEQAQTQEESAPPQRSAGEAATTGGGGGGGDIPPPTGGEEKVAAGDAGEASDLTPPPPPRPASTFVRTDPSIPRERCACGTLPDNTDKFCPNCGNPAVVAVPKVSERIALLSRRAHAGSRGTGDGSNRVGTPQFKAEDGGNFPPQPRPFATRRATQKPVKRNPSAPNKRTSAELKVEGPPDGWETFSTYPYDTLKKRPLPEGLDINPMLLEYHLSDLDFAAVFKVDKAAYSAMPMWKRTELKKAAHLF